MILHDPLEVEAAGGLAVHGARAVPGATDVRAALVADGVPGLLAAGDPTLRGPAAETDAKVRLGWLDTFRRSREMLPRLAELRDEYLGMGVDHVVLAGVGGPSLAAEVIARTLDVDLTVLDSTDPQRVRAVLADRPATTVVVVADGPGGTLETDSHRRVFQETGIGPRMVVVVTDAGPSLEQFAEETGAPLFRADPDVGRYSALTAFGLVPAALAGVDVAELLDQAEAFAESLGHDDDNPALTLGAALASAALAGRDKVALVSDGTGIVGLPDWVEQLVAGSTGQDGRGILPVVLAQPDSPGAHRADVLTVTVGGALTPGTVPGGGTTPHIAVNGPLGAQFLAWEYATTVAGRLLGVDPFDQPDVAAGRDDTARLLDSPAVDERPAFVDGPIKGYGADLGGASTVEEALGWLLSRIDPDGYLGVLAFLDREADAGLGVIRDRLADHTVRAVTFGWGPRYLHSTGQYHKGGPATGSFLLVTGASGADLPVPGRSYTFGQLEAAQATGDRQALAGRGRPLVHLHLTDRTAGVARLLAAADALPWVS
jgi:hypothetical protein